VTVNVVPASEPTATVTGKYQRFEQSEGAVVQLNHLDKIFVFSDFRPGVIIRVGTPTVVPMDPRPQDLGDFISAFAEILFTITLKGVVWPRRYRRSGMATAACAAAPPVPQARGGREDEEYWKALHEWRSTFKRAGIFSGLG